MNRNWQDLCGLVLAILICAAQDTTLASQTRAQADAARRQMVDRFIVGEGVKNQRVIQAMLATPRHEFVPRDLRKHAYKDMSLPIGDRQTISSPFIVAFMTEAIDPQPTDKVLEIGTGSGYQAAVLSGLVQDVFTIEIVESLGRTAQRTLQRLRYKNVHTKIGDGFRGWKEHAPFDKIIATCSPESIPQPLVEQLREGGLMVIPAGRRYQQTLYLLRKRNGKLETEALRPTLFVPMTGTAEGKREQQPDPKNPAVANSGFEKRPLQSGFVPDWYYQRQATWITDDDAPEGQHYLSFKNDDPGRLAMAQQGFPVDGREVSYLKVSAHVKYDGVRRGRNSDDMAGIVVTFYDENRRPLGHRWIGPFQGTDPWHRVSELLRVPTIAREAILRIGLFGAVGEISYDQIQLESSRR